MPYDSTIECKSYKNMPCKSSLVSKPEPLASQLKSLVSHTEYGSYQLRNAHITAGIVYAWCTYQYEQWYGCVLHLKKNKKIWCTTALSPQNPTVTKFCQIKVWCASTPVQRLQPLIVEKRNFTWLKPRICVSFQEYCAEVMMLVASWRPITKTEMFSMKWWILVPSKHKFSLRSLHFGKL